MRKIDKYRGIVGFLDPEMIILKRINEEADEVEAYIVKALLAQQDKECIFVVCQEGYHWALLVIFPKWNTVYNIDSKGYQSPSCYSIKKLFDEAFGAYVDKKGRHNKNFGRTVIWKHFQAHIQPPGSMLCGQYVMYHMLSFADNLSLDRDRYPQGRAGFATCPLLPDEIANVRERLLDFFMNEVIDIGGSCRVEGASYN
ncbi:uncharacterized protein [Zea mays]|uniref:uncharacterized protein n=1 Tax=Zea mays TaxID=4577 RepID=UPI0009AA18FA|nr:uncharacterized protein LOC109939426 [Zea mays]XP_020404926.1 uncharacterized protein LOC109939275 [Zea mays]|eukprot:XP_020393200.1 uncharacterized protein LOC109939426 [Zea mays]